MYIMKKWIKSWNATTFLEKSVLAFIIAAIWQHTDGAIGFYFYNGFELLAMLLGIAGFFKLMQERKEK